MKKLLQLLSKYSGAIMNLNHVVGVGCGYKEIGQEKTDEEALVVLVEEKLNADQLESEDFVPDKIEEARTDVIEVGELELLTPTGLSNRTNLVSQVSRFDKLRPAKPGSSVGHYKISAGTFGAVVKDRESGQPLILSNNHILANLTTGRDKRAKQGDPILQPGRYDNGGRRDVVAYLERFSPLRRKEEDSSNLFVQGLENVINEAGSIVKFPYLIKFVRKNNNRNLVDCAVAKPKSTDLISDEIMELGRVNGIAAPKVGMPVVKSGRTSGVTRSRIKAVHATVEVNITANEKGVFSDQIITDPFSKPGDSGALVLDSNNRAVGLLFAGSAKSTICNRIDNVLEELDVELV